MMPRSLPRSSALLIAVRATVLAALTMMAIACAGPNATAPTVEVLRHSAGAVRTEAARANGQGPQACVPDTKLIGRFAASTDDVPGTWWRLTKDRFDALGVTD
jgi:hypothetical protein